MPISYRVDGRSVHGDKHAAGARADRAEQREAWPGQRGRVGRPAAPRAQREPRSPRTARRQRTPPQAREAVRGAVKKDIKH